MMLEPFTPSDLYLFLASLTLPRVFDKQPHCSPQTLVSIPCPKYALPQVPL